MKVGFSEPLNFDEAFKGNLILKNQRWALYALYWRFRFDWGISEWNPSSGSKVTAFFFKRYFLGRVSRVTFVLEVAEEQKVLNGHLILLYSNREPLFLIFTFRWLRYRGSDSQNTLISTKPLRVIWYLKISVELCKRSSDDLYSIKASANEIRPRDRLLQPFSRNANF